MKSPRRQVFGMRLQIAEQPCLKSTTYTEWQNENIKKPLTGSIDEPSPIIISYGSFATTFPLLNL